MTILHKVYEDEEYTYEFTHTEAGLTISVDLKGCIAPTSYVFIPNPIAARIWQDGFEFRMKVLGASIVQLPIKDAIDPSVEEDQE